MSERNCYLAIDQGTHASRALLFNDSGQKLSQHRVRLAPLASSDPDRVEYDGERMLESVRLAVREAQAFARQQNLEVLAAGLATQRSSVIAWEPNTCEPLSPLLSWQDTRARDWIEQTLSPAADEIRRVSGLPLSPHYGASKLRWLQLHVRDGTARDATSECRFGPLVTWLLEQIVEQRSFCVDHANAGRTQLFDFRKRQWDPWLVKQFQLEMDQLPELRANVSPYGTLKNLAGDSPGRTQLTAVQGDQSAALYGHGRLEEGTAVVNLGTGAFVCLPVRAPVECDSLLSGIACSTPDDVEYLLEGTVNGCGAALDWAIKHLRITDRPFELLEESLADAAGKAQPYRFLNGVNGIGSPFWKPKDQRYWVDTDGNRVEAESLRGPLRGTALTAVAESIVFLIQANLDVMTASGARPTQLRVSGGVSRSDGICQRIANLSRLIVRRSSVSEATARGVAWLAAGQPASWNAAEGSEAEFRPEPDSALDIRYRAHIDWMQRVV